MSDKFKLVRISTTISSSLEEEEEEIILHFNYSPVADVELKQQITEVRNSLRTSTGVSCLTRIRDIFGSNLIRGLVILAFVSLGYTQSFI
jgi:hypothetical protein